MSGVADHFAENDATRCSIARDHRRPPEPAQAACRRAARREPRYAADELYGIVPPTRAARSTSAR
jgi:acetyl-CoA carboxylase carboxyltransferase component